MAYRFKHGDRPLDDYTIQRAVGSGGFGEVYYAVSDGGREVALKYLRDNPQVELRGVSHCINLKSPHLVSIFDVKKNADDEYFIIMEYCSGPSLRDLLIAEPNGFEPQKAAFFTRELAKGLAYLHDRGIVHRDLKPGNIFYDDGYVKIGDYGLSKFIAVSRHSAQTASVGTVHYMAPEIGSGDYSRGVDIYALGVMLYEMLLGKVPFEGSSMGEVLMKHLTAQPEVDHLPHPFGQVIRRALEKDPKDRYQAVDEMIDELLTVAEVKESLAGFSPQSLEGAVHRGAADRAASPMPSPNPIPGYARDFARPADEVHRQPPYAKPIRGDVAFPDRLAKKMDRISRKLDQKIGKLAGKRVHHPPPSPPSPDAAAQSGSGPVASPFAAADRRKRIVLSGLLCVGLAVGLGLLIGNAYCEEAGASAGLLVAGMSGGIVLSRSAVRWFGAQYGPNWARRLIRLCCCAPLLAIGAAPLFDSRYDSEGLAIFLGLLLLAAFANWDKTFDKASAGEMCFWTALWAAFCGFLATAIVGAIAGGGADEFAFIAAGVAGAASLIIQATSWWLPARTAHAFGRAGVSPGPRQEDHAAAAATPPPLPDQTTSPSAEQVDQQSTTEVGTSTDESHAHYGVDASLPGHPRLRWGITRAFWSVIAFVLMGGAIVTFLIPLIAEDMPHGDITASIVACTGFASFMIFALRKTTPHRRDGFWRDTLRPFLISLMMFGIGGTITGIAREWGSCCVGDEGRVALVAGLVMCSIAFLGLLFFTGRRRRAPKPFVLDGAGNGSRPDSNVPHVEAPARESEPNRDTPMPDRLANNPAASSVETLKPHRGVTVLVLGVLGINLFPLGIAAWVMAHHDLLDMKAGRMDPSGRGITAAGRICGIISVVIACIGTVIGLCVAFLTASGAIVF
ncbi:MAG: serine/threonine-protein kinase [Phycisphaerae bacterium]